MNLLEISFGGTRHWLFLFEVVIQLVSARLNASAKTQDNTRVPVLSAPLKATPTGTRLYKPRAHSYSNSQHFDPEHVHASSGRRVPGKDAV